MTNDGLRLGVSHIIVSHPLVIVDVLQQRLMTMMEPEPGVLSLFSQVPFTRTGRRLARQCDGLG
jgi:ABC-type phosphonate transport system ATPase subunit